MRYFEWDYDQNIVTEYLRFGECNQCGDCCRAEISFRVCTEPYGEGADQTGVWTEVQNDAQRFAIRVLDIKPKAKICSGLSNSTSTCSEHMNKKPVCELWPLNPLHTEPFPDCSYAFTKIAEWQIFEDSVMRLEQ